MAEFWERNRQFLTQVLAGAGAFLVLSYLVLSIGSESSSDRKSRQKLVARGAALQRSVGDRSGLPAESVKEVETALEARTAEVCVRVPADLSEDRTTLATRFLAAKENECAALNALAAQAGVDIKVALSSVDFHQRETDDRERYEERWATLACFRRLIEAAVRSGFSEILAVVCEGTQAEAVPGEPGWTIARYGVRIELAGDFESFMRLYAEVHQPGKFLLLAIGSVRPREVEGGAFLQGTVTGWAVRLLETKERAGKAAAETPIERFKR